MRWLLLLFVAVPLLEVYLLAGLARTIDVWPTIGFVLLTGAIGAWLAKREGLRVWREWRESLHTLTPPPRGMVDGLLVLAGACLLISPGVLTDLVGMLLLVPWTRGLAAAQVRRLIDRRIAVRSSVARAANPAGPSGEDEVVDTEGVGVDTSRR